MAERGGEIEIKGRRLAYRELGEGPPLLLINGYAAAADDWDPMLLEALAGSRRVICPDNRGIGSSELGDPPGVTIESMAADLETLLMELDLSAVAVAGWSMGGFVAQALTRRCPERVAALALMATDPGGPGALRAAPDVWSRLTDHSGTARQQATRLIKLLFPPQVAESIDRDFGELVAAARAELDIAALLAQERAMEGWFRGEAAGAALGDRPVLVLHGAEDVVIPPGNVELLAAVWPGAQVRRFDGCGHAFMAQEPELTARLIVASAAS